MKRLTFRCIEFVLTMALLLAVVGCEPGNPLRPSDEDNDTEIGSTNNQSVSVVVVIHDHPDDGDTAVPNRAPRLTSPGAQTSTSGDTVRLSLTATDPDDDLLSWVAGGLPRDLTIDPVTGVISGEVSSSSADDSPFSVTVAVSDGALSASVVFAWTVQAAP